MCYHTPFTNFLVKLLTIRSFFPQKWRPTKVRSYEKEEASRKKKQLISNGSNNAMQSTSSQSSSSHAVRRSSRVRTHTSSEVLPSSTTSSPRTTVVGSASAKQSNVRFDTNGPAIAHIESRSRTNSEQVADEVGPPPQSPAISVASRHDRDRAASAVNTSTSSSSSSAGRTTFGISGARVMDEHLSAQQFAFLAESKLLFTCGHWDHSCRITNAETGNLVQSVRQHRDVITCLALAKDFGQRWLVTGSRDCTLMVWDVSTDRELPLKSQPQYILYGHDDSVTCVAINPELDVVVSGSDDGSVIIHNLRDGTYVRSIVDSAMTYSSIAKNLSALNADASFAEEASIHGDLLDGNGRRMSLRPSAATTLALSNHPSSPSHASSGAQAAHRKITWVGLSKEAYVITYSADDQLLSTFSMNGLLISSRTVPEALYAFMLSEDGKVLITGGSSCLVVFRWVRFCSFSSLFLCVWVFVLFFGCISTLSFVDASIT